MFLVQSGARARGRWPPAPQKRCFPRRLAGALSLVNSEKVRIGNEVVRVSVSLASSCRFHGVPGSIENPATSRLFGLESTQRFMRHKVVRNFNLDFCAFGAP